MPSDVTTGDPVADGTEGRGDSEQGQGAKQRTRGPCETVSRASSRLRCSDRPDETPGTGGTPRIPTVPRRVSTLTGTRATRAEGEKRDRSQRGEWPPCLTAGPGTPRSMTPVRHVSPRWAHRCADETPWPPQDIYPVIMHPYQGESHRWTSGSGDSPDSKTGEPLPGDSRECNLDVSIPNVLSDSTGRFV